MICKFSATKWLSMNSFFRDMAKEGIGIKEGHSREHRKLAGTSIRSPRREEVHMETPHKPGN